MSKKIGFSIIFLAVFLSVIIKCPAGFLEYTMYISTGVAICLIFFKSAESSKFNLKVPGVSIALVGAVAVPVSLCVLRPIDHFKSNACNINLGITVFVHGKKGKQDMILRQQGYVIMDINGERKRSEINDNGQAFFQNLHEEDKVKLDIDFSEPYRSMKPDSIYIIHVDSNIYLPVVLLGINHVSGTVMFNDMPLNGVVVKLKGATDNLLDTTNQTGDFKFNIPEELQKKEYEVWFIKDGFRTRKHNVFPQTGASLDIVMEKK